jgi:hypothetical protein
MWCTLLGADTGWTVAAALIYCMCIVHNSVLLRPVEPKHHQAVGFKHTACSTLLLLLLLQG